ncbi:MAG: NAD(P)H-binding protein [Deltaproteobacteria bacterium]
MIRLTLSLKIQRSRDLHDACSVEGHPTRNAENATRLTVARAEVTAPGSLDAVVAGCDAVISVVGTAYTRKPVTIYSDATRNIVHAMRAGGCKRLVVVSSGLTYPPTRSMGLFFDHVAKPLLRNVLGRTLYADMRRMEEYLRNCDDIDWTVMRRARLTDEETVSAYKVEPDGPSRHFTSRADLAAAMLAEVHGKAHVHEAVAPTTR